MTLSEVQAKAEFDEDEMRDERDVAEAPRDTDSAR
jgi:hypothetical protein